MALNKITTFKLDDEHSALVVKIGGMTEAKTSHKALRNAIRLAFVVLLYQKTKQAGGATIPLEDYLSMMGGLP